MTTQGPPARIGATVAGRYLLLRLLGEGGMGAVYEAEHQVTKRRVAIKLMHASLGVNGTYLQRFIQEAQIATAIGHPNIVEVLDGGTDEHGAAFLAFALLEGEPVSALLKRRRPLPLFDALHIAAEVLDALGAAHDRGIVHRDIKPDNLFLAKEAKGQRSVKLLDFGISKLTHAPDGAHDPGGITRTGAILGTPAYMSPEQIEGGRDIDGRTDLWSVGAMLYEMITGQRPFRGDNISAVLVAVMSAPLVPPIQINAQIPQALSDVVMLALERDRARRYRTAAAMLADVRDIMASLASSDVARVSRAVGAPIASQELSPPGPAVTSDTLRPSLASLEPSPRRDPTSARGRALVLAVGVVIMAAAAASVLAIRRSDRATPRASTAQTASSAPHEIEPARAAPAVDEARVAVGRAAAANGVDASAPPVTTMTPRSRRRGTQPIDVRVPTAYQPARSSGAHPTVITDINGT